MLSISVLYKVSDSVERLWRLLRGEKRDWAPKNLTIFSERSSEKVHKLRRLARERKRDYAPLAPI